MLNSGYFITAELKVREEARVQEARAALTALCAQTLTEPGCSLFALHQDPSVPTRLLLWECFDDEAAFQSHFEEGHTKAYLAQGLTEVVRFVQTQLIPSSSSTPAS